MKNIVDNANTAIKSTTSENIDDAWFKEFTPKTTISDYESILNSDTTPEGIKYIIREFFDGDIRCGLNLQ